jgi:hypothetical protein
VTGYVSTLYDPGDHWLGRRCKPADEILLNAGELLGIVCVSCASRVDNANALAVLSTYSEDPFTPIVTWRIHIRILLDTGGNV